MNCVITGHTRGIGKAIFEKYGGIGLSRSNGFDIVNNSIIPYIDKDSIFINNAFTMSDPFAQIRLLYESIDKCKHVICIGSNTKYQGIYKTSKDALNLACNDLFLQGYNVTNIKLGKTDTPFQKDYNGDKISIKSIIQTLDYIFSIEERINEISIRPRNE